MARRRSRDGGPAGLDRLLESEPARHALYQRSLIVVLVSQVFGGAGLAAGVTVGALLAQDMLGTEGFSGLPAALFTLGSASAAFLVGRLTQLSGRRHGLAAGFLAGALGAAGIVEAAVIDSPTLLFVAMFVYGSGTASNLQAAMPVPTWRRRSAAPPRSASPWSPRPWVRSPAPTWWTRRGG
jgi:MFS family permease